MRKEGYNWSYSWNYTGDWYLLRAKFMNDWNFFVREVGRGRGVQERNLEVTEVSRRGGRRWCRHEAGLDIFWKKDLESLSRLYFSELRLVTLHTLQTLPHHIWSSCQTAQTERSPELNTNHSSLWAAVLIHSTWSYTIPCLKKFAKMFLSELRQISTNFDIYLARRWQRG